MQNTMQNLYVLLREEKMYLVKHNKIYHLIYHDENGKLVSKTTSQKTKTEANKFVKEYFSKKVKVRDEQKDITFAEFYQFYIEYSSTRFSTSYQEFVDIAFRQFQKVLQEAIPLKSIKVNHVENFIQGRLKVSGERIVNGYLRTLQAAFERAVELGYLETNIFRKIKKLRAKQNPPLFLSKEEFQYKIGKVVSTTSSLNHK